jgi:hypothetical protein
MQAIETVARILVNLLYFIFFLIFNITLLSYQAGH